MMAKFGIGQTIDQEKAAREAAEVKVIKKVRLAVFSLRRACQVCHGRRVSECEGLPDEMHEDPSRAKTRGLPPDERFNLRVCGRLCHACHRDVTENRLRLVFEDPIRRFLGLVTAEAV